MAFLKMKRVVLSRYFVLRVRKGTKKMHHFVQAFCSRAILILINA
jgi:hypothetical protein